MTNPFAYGTIYANDIAYTIVYTNRIALSIDYCEIMYVFCEILFGKGINMEFKDKLKEKRMAAKLSQTELAAVAGVSLRTIQNYELGSRKPQHMEVVQKMADALGTTVEYLLGSEGTHIVNAYERGGARAARDVEGLVSEIRGLFAGGELDEDEKDAIMAALNRAYWDAKEDNKKYAPKKSKGE